MVDNAFDLRLFKAKNHIEDALGMNRRGQQPMQQQPLRPMPSMQQPMQQGQMPMQQPMQQPQMQQPQMQQPMQQPAQPQAFAKGGLAMAEGGAWTRKEGKNPEGGLNAKGRASLRAQGQDIKPPVSAKQAKKSPKAAARRKSFCARSAGQAKMFPNAARDPESRLNKARRKWDC
jgi:hypothetical protein